MNCCLFPISPYSVELPRKDLFRMIKVVRLLYQLSENKSYQAYLYNELPDTAKIETTHKGVMMGYDFHLTESGPKLIEVNTNAGGAWFAFLSHYPQANCFAGRTHDRLLNMFLMEYQLFKKIDSTRPTVIAIVDSQPETQFLFPEMQVFAALLKQNGIACLLIDPEELTAKEDGLYYHHQQIDMIYNRHCDFYLQSVAMQPIRDAWLKQQVCLSPNPRIYGLLADKRRMILWSDSQSLISFGLNQQDYDLLLDSAPATQLLSAFPVEEVWRSRKQWVFKPVNSYASKGVYVGHKLTTAKLAQLDPQHTLMQQWIPPSSSHYEDELPFKTDFRLFAYRQQILGVSARLYHGQVTNLNTANGGFAKVNVI